MSDTTSPAEPAISTAAPPERHPFSWLPYAQLVRLPNVFTAMADIALAALVAGALPTHAAAVLLVLLASGCLYCSGMVWNDYFDLEQDKRERPFRPLPSGRVSPQAAARLGAALLAAGVGLAALAGLAGGELRTAPVILAGLLALAILLYDAVLKRTVLGPVGMGACRFLNVLLGLSVVPDALGAGVLLAAVVGTYIAGVTWLARTEAVRSRKGDLIGAAGVMLAGLLLALAVPLAFRPVPRGDTASPLGFAQIALGQILFPYLLVAFGFYLGGPVLRAVARPDPERVQAAVKRAVLGLVLLDAILAAAVVGTAGLLLALLLLPASYLGRRIYST
jgi:4-hydroxybenzoate polyprenyltransferase